MHYQFLSGGLQKFSNSVHGWVSMNALSLSILIPVYNERYLAAASISRVLALQNDLINDIEVIIVDDGSNDGTWEVLREIANADSKVKLIKHDRNLGKGAAIQTAVKHATKDICIIHDADMEYEPQDIPSLLIPFVNEGADAVYGSRYLTASYRRVLLFRHSILNKCVTFLVNWFTDLDLTDVETCYKAIKTRLLKSIPIRSKDFRFEVEITMKLAKRKIRIFEVPIHYLPRTREEGKKIDFKDGILALFAMVRFSIIEDLYQKKAYGLKILADMNHARRFNKWMANTLRPYLGKRVFEIGAGIGTLTNEFIPRELYVASDIDHHALDYLNAYAIGKPYLQVLKIDACCTQDFANLADHFDTILIINVLEHVADEDHTLRNLYSALMPSGKIIILVPQYPALYGSFDKALHHRERYTKEKLLASMTRAGFAVEKIFDFNRFTVPSWYLNGKILKRKHFSLLQLKILETLMPIIRRIDPFLPWGGLSIIGIGLKPK